MKNLILLFIGLTLTGCTHEVIINSVPRTHLVDSAEAVENLDNAVVALVRPQLTDEEPAIPDDVSTLGKKHEAYCTGVFISYSKILTAAHCVQRRSVQTIMTPFGPIDLEMPNDESPIGDVKKITTHQDYLEDGSLKTYRTYHVVEYNRDIDLALLEVSTECEGSCELDHSWLAVAPTAPRQGETVYTLGHPGGLMYTLTSGLVSRARVQFGDDPGVYFQSSSQAFFGNSGGPVVNEKGEIVGICSAILYRQPHLSLYVHTTMIRRFLDE